LQLHPLSFDVAAYIKAGVNMIVCKWICEYDWL